MAMLLAPSYETTIAEWRREHQKEVDGWLTYAGLTWLDPGRNEVRGQIFEFREGQVYSSGRALKPDSDDNPDLITAADGSKLVAVVRGDKTGIRVKDANSSYRRGFKGLKWWPVQPGYRVEAKFTTYPEPKTLPVANVLGIVEQRINVGYAEFSLHGEKLRMEAVVSGKELFYPFRDRTAGKQTYPAVRFLYSEYPKDGGVTLDFNKAHNPACAFTDFATCPLPPKQNILPVPIEAGEIYAPELYPK